MGKWIGKLGHMAIDVNAKTPLAAMDMAIESAWDNFFEFSEILSENDKLPLDFRSHESSSILDYGDEERQGGAWLVSITRLGHLEEGKTSEYKSDYMVTNIEFCGAMPHPSPMASDDSEHWNLVAISMRENLAIQTHIGPDELSQNTSRKTRI